jgi:RND family efflux transporter MFP subunit
VRTSWGLDARHSRRALVWLAVAAAALVTLVVWRLQGSAEAQASQSLATATRGPMVVTVGGVGQIVDGLSGKSSTPASPASGGGATAPANAVYPSASGTVSNVLVQPGQKVAAGQVLAVVDDGGVTSSAAAQAQIDLETALLELPPSARTGALGVAVANVSLARQRLAQARGPASRSDLATADAEVAKARADLAALLKPAIQPPTAEALTAARTAVRVAEQRLAKLTGPPDPAAVATAEAEVKKAEADLEALVRSDRTQPVTQREIDAARAAINAAKARLAKLLGPADSADVAAAQLELERAQADLAALLRPGASPSPEAIASAQQALVAAQEKRKRLRQGSTQADISAAHLEVLRAQSDLRTLRIAMRKASGPGSTSDVSVRLGLLKIQAAQNRLSAARAAQGMLEVTSPWNGTVSAVLVAEGARVDVTTPVATVSDLDHLAVNVNLSEFDVAQVEVGMRAAVDVDALGGETFYGKVVFVALTGTDTGGVVTFPVRVGLSDTEGLKPGMNTSVRIIVAKKLNAIRVPLEAVSTNDADQEFVMVLDEEGQQTEVEVETGLENNERIEIVEGVKAGTRVVLPELTAVEEE